MWASSGWRRVQQAVPGKDAIAGPSSGKGITGRALAALTGSSGARRDGRDGSNQEDWGGGSGGTTDHEIASLEGDSQPDEPRLHPIRSDSRYDIYSASF